MDSCLLSDVIKGHPLMVGAERTNLLLEAFEHHALRYDAHGLVYGMQYPQQTACLICPIMKTTSLTTGLLAVLE